MGRLLSFVSVCALVANAQAAEPTVHLLNMGQAPQAPLQLSAAEVVRSLALVIETKVTMQVGAMTIPTTELPTVVLNLAWRATGGKNELVIEAVDVRAVKGASTVVADELRAATAALVGKVVRIAAEAPATATESPVVAQTLAELRAVLAHLMVPLPFEPVGVSAQWEAMRTVKRRGLEAVERAVYELLERDGQTIRVKVAFDVGANPQDLGEAELTELEGRGTGEIVLRLDQPGPVDGAIAFERTLKLRDGEQDLVLTTETKVALSSL